MDEAEALFDSAPDSALQILREIPGSDLSGASQHARHALLLSMALDKNYIDTTTFDVLRPALDYYPKHGTPDERLRTLFYQGRIYDNAGVYDSAMICFVKALRVEGIKDSLTYGTVLMAQGDMAHRFYDVPVFIENSLAAAKIFENYPLKPVPRVDALCKALIGVLEIKDRTRADSVARRFIPLLNQVPEKSMYRETKNRYYIQCGDSAEIKNAVEDSKSHTDFSFQNNLNIIIGCCRLGNCEEAYNILDRMPPASNLADSVALLTCRYEILRSSGKQDEALAAYEQLYVAIDLVNQVMWKSNMRYMKIQPEIDMENDVTLGRRSITVLHIGLGCAVLMLVLIVGMKLYGGRWRKIDNSLKEHARIDAERASVSAELQLVEEEKANLEHLLAVMESHASEAKTPVMKSVIKRIEILNSLLAREITDNERHGKTYGRLVDKLHRDKEDFIHSTVEVFTSTYPKFMSRLREQGLTERELEIVCLFGLGLNGKEIGVYLNLKSQYNMTSAIRGKLSLDSRETNLPIYIRQKMAEEYGEESEN